MTQKIFVIMRLNLMHLRPRTAARRRTASFRDDKGFLAQNLV
jgi:hypothetical protein